MSPLNGTSVETGKRIITSDIDTKDLFRDAYDLHHLLVRSDSNHRHHGHGNPGSMSSGS